MMKRLAILAGLAFGILTGWSVAALASRSSTGTYTLPAGNPVVTGTTITSTWANNTLADVSTELTGSLSRSGYGGMLAPLRGTNGSSAAPAFSFTSDTDTGIYRSAANDLRCAVGGVDGLVINSAVTSVSNGVVSAATLSATTGITSSTASVPVLKPIAVTSAEGSTLTPSTTFTGSPSTSTLTVTGRAGTTGGATGVTFTGGAATVSGQGGTAGVATAGASITGGVSGWTGIGSGTGGGLSGVGGASGPGLIGTSGGGNSPVAGQVHLTPTTNAPSAPTDGDIWFKASGPPGFYANGTAYYLQSGSITLSTGSGTASSILGQRCVCSDSTANASVKCVLAGSTLTATGTGSDVIYYICL